MRTFSALLLGFSSLLMVSTASADDMEFYKNGTQQGELRDSGDVYINGTKAGEIRDNGSIYIRGVNQGSIDADGDLHWGGGSEKGRITKDGDIYWGGGASKGEIRDGGAIYFNGTQWASVKNCCSSAKDKRRAFALAIVFFDALLEI